MRSRLDKICEVCGCSDRAAIHLHHMIPRTDPRSTNDMGNLAVLCANCHTRTHSSEIILEGVYMTSVGAKLFWHFAGKPHIVRPGIFLQKDGTARIMEE